MTEKCPLKPIILDPGRTENKHRGKEKTVT